MRILGDIPNPKYKITILEMNARLSIQIEDGDIVQTYKFRDGSMVTNVNEANRFCDAQFLDQVALNFDTMRANVKSTLERKTDELEDEFDVII